MSIGGPDLRVRGAVAVPLIEAREGAEIFGPIFWKVRQVRHDETAVVGCCPGPNDGLQCEARYQRLLEGFPTATGDSVETLGDDAGDANKIDNTSYIEG